MLHPLRSLLCASALVLLGSTLAHGGFVNFSAGGDANPATIQPTVDAFRAALGNPNNANTAGPLASGRREINWDGGGAATSISGTPFTGFLNNRGASFSTPGTGFVQAPLTGLDTTFANATYSTIFNTFSAQRLFTPTASNITDVTFFIPGSSGGTAATVSGFGAVFTDVDLANTTRLQFFDANNVQIFSQTVTPGSVSNGSLSFLGGIANAGEQIFRVRITTGNAALGPNDGGGVDVVAMDDFIFAEPQAVSTNGVPLPASVWGGLGLGGLLAVRVLRKKLRQVPAA